MTSRGANAKPGSKTGSKPSSKPTATPGVTPSVTQATAAGPAAAADPMPTVYLYTDGACSGNPGPGGWAYILKHPASGKERKDAGAEPETTNNRMELRAVIEGLAALSRPTRVELTSDSQYVLKGLKEWMKGWKAKGWKTASKAPVKNRDLWEALDALTQRHELEFHWIRGHQGHAENEECDRMAVEAYRTMQR